MKKGFIFVLVSVFMIMPAFAAKYPNLNLKQIKNKSSISYNEKDNTWSNSVNKKKDIYFTKTNGFGAFYDYLDANKNFAFSTECEYEFIYNGHLMGYSDRYLKFFDITFNDGEINKRELSKEEVQAMLPNYEIVMISEFSKKTNAYKIKKGFGNLKLLILNDTDSTFDGYRFTSGNAEFEQYDLRGFIKVTKNGMIQFSTNNSDFISAPWYILLIR